MTNEVLVPTLTPVINAIETAAAIPTSYEFQQKHRVNIDAANTIGRKVIFERNASYLQNSTAQDLALTFVRILAAEEVLSLVDESHSDRQKTFNTAIENIWNGIINDERRIPLNPEQFERLVQNPSDQNLLKTHYFQKWGDFLRTFFQEGTDGKNPGLLVREIQTIASLRFLLNNNEKLPEAISKKELSLTLIGDHTVVAGPATRPSTYRQTTDKQKKDNTGEGLTFHELNTVTGKSSLQDQLTHATMMLLESKLWLFNTVQAYFQADSKMASGIFALGSLSEDAILEPYNIQRLDNTGRIPEVILRGSHELGWQAEQKYVPLIKTVMESVKSQ